MPCTECFASVGKHCIKRDFLSMITNNGMQIFLGAKALYVGTVICALQIPGKIRLTNILLWVLYCMNTDHLLINSLVFLTLFFFIFIFNFCCKLPCCKLGIPISLNSFLLRKTMMWLPFGIFELSPSNSY